MQNALGMGAVALLTLALAVGATVYLAPGIARDMRIWDNPVLVPQARIRDAKCRTRVAVFVSCEAKIAYSVDGRSYTSDVDFSFFDLHFGSYEGGVVRAADRPGLATLTLGIDMMWNRIALLVGLVALFVAVFVALTLRSMRSARIGLLTRHPVDVTPTAVNIVKVVATKVGRTVTYAFEHEGRKSKVMGTLKEGEQPFFLSNRPNDSSALAVFPATSPIPILLDEALARVELTDAERQALYAARQRDIAPPQSWAQAGPAG